MKKSQKIKLSRLFLKSLLIGMILFSGFINVQAEEKEQKPSEQNEMSGFYTTVNKESRLYQEANEKSEAIAKIKSGDSLYIIGKDIDGWYQTIYDGKKAYVKTEDLKETDPTEQLVQEMSQHFEEEKAQIEAFERERKNRRNTKIWGSIIVVLILAIFAFNIRTTMRQEKSVPKK